MKKNLKFKTRDWYLICIFSVIVLCFSLCISIIFSQIEKVNRSNAFNISEVEYFELKTPKSVSSKILIDSVKNYKDVYLETYPLEVRLNSDRNNFGKLIYSNQNEIFIPELMEGRYFTPKELQSSDSKIVIDVDIKNLVDENKQIEIKNKKYDVIGVMGDSSGKSIYEDDFIVPMKSMEVNMTYPNRIVLGGTNVDYIKRNLSESKVDFINSKPLNEVDIEQIIERTMDFIKIFIQTTIIGILSIFIIMRFWSRGYTKEIGVKKALGATNLRIILEVFLKYQLVLMVSFFIGSITHLLLQSILNSILPYVNLSYTFYNIFLVYIVAMIMGLLSGVWPIMKAMKTNPSISIKGNI